MVDLATQICNIPPTIFLDFLSSEVEDALFMNDAEDEFVFFSSYLYFLSVQISKNCALFRNHGSSLSLRWLQEPFSDDILDIWITCSIVITKWAYPKGKCIWQAAHWSKKADSCDCMGPSEPRDLPSNSRSFWHYNVKCITVHWKGCKGSCGCSHRPYSVAKR